MVLKPSGPSLKLSKVLIYQHDSEHRKGVSFVSVNAWNSYLLVFTVNAIHGCCANPLAESSRKSQKSLRPWYNILLEPSVFYIRK